MLLIENGGGGESWGMRKRGRSGLGINSYCVDESVPDFLPSYPNGPARNEMVPFLVLSLAITIDKEVVGSFRNLRSVNEHRLNLYLAQSCGS